MKKVQLSLRLMLIFLSILLSFSGCIMSSSAEITSSTSVVLASSEKNDSPVIEESSSTISSEKVTVENSANTSESKQVTVASPIDSIEFDKLQQFFIDLPTSFTMDELESMIQESNFYFSKLENIINKHNDSEDNYTMYIIATESDRFGVSGSVDGKRMNVNFVFYDYIAVAFDTLTKDLEYFMYVNKDGIHHIVQYAFYYNSGRFGNGNPIWDKYTVEKLSGNYFYANQDLSFENNEAEITVHFRNDKDVPTAYRGDISHTGLIRCQDAAESVRCTIIGYIEH